MALDTARRLRVQLTEHLDAAQSTEADCPGCGATHGVPQITGTSPTVDAWMRACGMHWRARWPPPPCPSWPTPDAAAAHGRPARRPAHRGHPTLREGTHHARDRLLPVTELVNIDAMASVDTVVRWCRLCGHHGTATTRPAAHSEGIEHLSAQHHATIGIAPKAPAGRRGPAPPCLVLPVAGRFPSR
jgi:hypothetical protein